VHWCTADTTCGDHGTAGGLLDGRENGYLLIFATGAKRIEARMQKRPGYRDYQQRVAFFFPVC
jgi:hypothetical protein